MSFVSKTHFFYKFKIGCLRLFYVLGISGTLYLLYNEMNAQKKDAVTIDSKLPGKTHTHKHSLTIQNSTFEGVNQALDPYTIQTHKLVKTNEDHYILDKVDGKYRLNYGDLLVEAEHGVMSNNNTVLDLQDNVFLRLQNLIFNTMELEMNLQTREARSHAAVSVNYKNSKITADRFTAENNGDILNFKGHVNATINLSDF